MAFAITPSAPSETAFMKNFMNSSGSPVFMYVAMLHSGVCSIIDSRRLLLSGNGLTVRSSPLTYIVSNRKTATGTSFMAMWISCFLFLLINSWKGRSSMVSGSTATISPSTIASSAFMYLRAISFTSGYILVMFSSRRE